MNHKRGAKVKEEQDAEQRVPLEIEQEDLPEIEQATEHPGIDETPIHAEKLRYENADRIYRDQE